MNEFGPMVMVFHVHCALNPRFGMVIFTPLQDIDLNSLENSYFEKGEGKKIFDWN